MPLTKVECEMLAQSLANELGPMFRQAAESEGNVVAAEITNLVYTLTDQMRTNKRNAPQVIFRDCQFGNVHIQGKEQ